MKHTETKQTETKQTSDILSTPKNPRSLIVLVAINGKKNSRYVINWALDNFLPKENIVFKLLHVCLTITSVPMPMGVMPMEQVREDIVQAYKQEVEWKTTEMLFLFKKLFLERKAQVDVLRIEGDDIASTIANEVAKGRVDKLVIGASSRGGMFTRKLNGPNFSSKISKSIPSFCTVYAIAKGRLSSVRQSYSETDESIKGHNSEKISSDRTFSRQSSLPIDSAVPQNSPRLDQDSDSYCEFSHGSPASQISESLSTGKEALLKASTDLTEINPSGTKSVDIMEGESDLPSSPTFSIASRVSSIRSQLTRTHSWISNKVSEAGSDSPTESEPFLLGAIDKDEVDKIPELEEALLASKATENASKLEMEKPEKQVQDAEKTLSLEIERLKNEVRNVESKLKDFKDRNDQLAREVSSLKHSIMSKDKQLGHLSKDLQEQKVKTERAEKAAKEITEKAAMEGVAAKKLLESEIAEARADFQSQLNDQVKDFYHKGVNKGYQDCLEDHGLSITVEGDQVMSPIVDPDSQILHDSTSRAASRSWTS